MLTYPKRLQRYDIFFIWQRFSEVFLYFCSAFIFHGRLMVEIVTGIVLRTIKYSDNLMIADMYTKERGRASFLVPVSRGKRSKVRSVMFQPLSMLTFTASKGKGKSLPRLSEVQPYVLYRTIPYDVAKSAVAIYIAEFLVAVLREEGENEALFAYLDYAFSFFDEQPDACADFHIIFLLQLTRFLGIYPNVEDVSRVCYFDLLAGSLVSQHPLHSHYLLPEDTVNFINLLKVDFNSIHTLSLNRKARGEYLALIQSYYGLHIPDFPDMKSMDVLRELFD